MKSKILIIMTIAAVVLAAAFVALLKSYVAVVEDRNRLESNQEVLMNDICFYKTKDSLSVASVGRLQLTVNELKQNKESLLQVIESLNIKVKRLISSNETSVKTEYVFRDVFRDSIINNTDTIRCVDFCDNWIKFVGCEDSSNTFTADIKTIDTIYTIVHRIPRKFLFFRFGTKAIKQEVISKNPHSKIVYTEYIELKRK